eukprot:1151886-Pelagomonas_calceolata.AAC.1
MVPMRFDLQPGSLAARPAQLFQLNERHPRKSENRCAEMYAPANVMAQNSGSVHVTKARHVSQHVLA